MILDDQVTRCRRCILTVNFPGISFDGSGLCSFCQNEPSEEDATEKRKSLKNHLGELLNGVRVNGKDREYDCLVAFSGGKDSTYTLRLLNSEYNLRCLAVTVDNGFLSEQAIKNCRIIAESLAIDHIFFKPSFAFLKNMYRSSLDGKSPHTLAAIKRASPVCNSCINLINNVMLKLAVQLNIPVIAGGYIGGQVPKDSAVISIDLENLSEQRRLRTSQYRQAFGSTVEKYFDLSPELLSRSPMKQISIINPMLTVEYSEEEILESLKGIGWIQPTDTGKNSSNCRLNDLGISDHYQKYKFHPYLFELAELVRKGFMDRETALKKVIHIPEAKDLSGIYERLA